MYRIILRCMQQKGKAMFFTGKQLAAARALASVTAAELAARAGVSHDTITKIESGKVQPREGTIADIAQALFSLGVEFSENGVRDVSPLQVFEGKDSYLSILEDIFLTLKDTGGEVLFSFVRNKLSPPQVIESDLRLRRLGIRFRSLIEEGDNYYLYPRREYRTVPKKFFHNNVQVIYGDKYACRMNETAKAFIVHDAALAAVQRNTFEFFWEHGRAPEETTAPETHE